MTTSTRPRSCCLCGKSGAIHSPDGINFFCFDPSPCLNRLQAKLEKTSYRDATPEMYELFRARQAEAKEYWSKCVLLTRDLKAALGLDNPEFLINTNRQFFDMCNRDPDFARKHAANPAKMEAEMRGEEDQC